MVIRIPCLAGGDFRGAHPDNGHGVARDGGHVRVGAGVTHRQTTGGIGWKREGHIPVIHGSDRPKTDRLILFIHRQGLTHARGGSIAAVACLVGGDGGCARPNDRHGVSGDGSHAGVG